MSLITATNPQTREEQISRRRREGTHAGGFRRRREGVLATTYDLADELSFASLERLHHIAVMDVLALDNGVARDRSLLLAVRVGLELLRYSEFASRLRALEIAALGHSPEFASLQRVVGPRHEADDGV